MPLTAVQVHLDCVTAIHDRGEAWTVVELDDWIETGRSGDEIDRRLLGASGAVGECFVERTPVNGSAVSLVAPQRLRRGVPPQQADAEQAVDHYQGNRGCTAYHGTGVRSGFMGVLGTRYTVVVVANLWTTMATVPVRPPAITKRNDGSATE